MKFSIAVIAAASGLVAAGPAAPTPNDAFSLAKRASLPIPASKGSVTLKAPQTVSGTFDGGMKTYGRGVSCTGQVEGGDKDAVFIVKNGGTLKNAIIGKDQIEGVHCEGSCTIENVWWVDVCEDALSLKGDGNAMVKGGGAQAAADKVVQHNGKGTVTIDGFTVVDFGKLYRACGNCKNSVARNVVVKNVKAYSGKVLTGINPNFGDSSTITNTCATSVKTICEEFKGTTPGNEPSSVSKGPSANCKYTASAIKAC
ncbi:polysaccharide lyase family 3 protein [Bipolaris maydis ATCC 48331]|uniref:Pectate lyase n=2 Tax=Cochliobolus heterostrophus TaxID=5016 RepID=M2U3X9_COCH5|nr:polysaccharide lyase family 3 protein [Bipolaris maydis ATCC 48331]EMD88436.1 polysaccharide lyase family 3 protein [Bipolaris maydis C5]KAH7556361.1 polysaccharide lyase family 3 protein [Bipolaris maydis]ENI00725.1 polysaccharide lyase family 3 protein [Bipolaris maydis ATCC 48331]KAJ5028428.1 polysaccharide lyase [Bipolaris maydis]KAJ5063197.1 pectate lyase precursor [Bipolaris maydis]